MCLYFIVSEHSISKTRSFVKQAMKFALNGSYSTYLMIYANEIIGHQYIQSSMG